MKHIGKCGSPAKLPKTEPASNILQWLDACDPLPTIAAELQQRHLRTKQKEQPDWENSKGQQPQKGTGSAHSLLTAMGIHVGGIKSSTVVTWTWKGAHCSANEGATLKKVRSGAAAQLRPERTESWCQVPATVGCSRPPVPHRSWRQLHGPRVSKLSRHWDPTCRCTQQQEEQI